MLNYERGSEWRRWDLHIHTPGTLKNDQYEGKTIEEKWDNFYDTIVQYIGDGTDPLKTIEVIGITDYLSIDNYNKVMKDRQTSGRDKACFTECRITDGTFCENGSYKYPLYF